MLGRWSMLDELNFWAFLPLKSLLFQGASRENPGPFAK